MFQLFGDTVGDEFRVQFGLFDLHNVQDDLLAGEFFELGDDLVLDGTFTADDHARFGGMDGDDDTVLQTFDLDSGDRGILIEFVQEFADFYIFMQ